MTRLPHGAFWIDERPVPVMRIPWMMRVALVLGALVWFFAIIGVRSLFAQVDATLRIKGTDAEMRIANPTQKPLKVTVTLYRNDSTHNPPLGDSVPTRISPNGFVLQPGAQQIVRLRLKAKVTAGEVLRLGTIFAPLDETPKTKPQPTVQFILQTRLITRVEVISP